MQALRTLWGQRIITARRAAGLTQVQLAAAVGVPQQTISQWERGVAAPRDDRRPHLARALGITVAELFAYPDGTNGGKAA